MCASVQMLIRSTSMFTELDIERDSQTVVCYRHHSCSVVVGWTGHFIYAWWIYLCGAGARDNPFCCGIFPKISRAPNSRASIDASFLVRRGGFIHTPDLLLDHRNTCFRAQLRNDGMAEITQKPDYPRKGRNVPLRNSAGHTEAPSTQVTHRAQSDSAAMGLHEIQSKSCFVMVGTA